MLRVTIAVQIMEASNPTANFFVSGVRQTSRLVQLTEKPLVRDDFAAPTVSQFESAIYSPVRSDHQSSESTRVGGKYEVPDEHAD